MYFCHSRSPLTSIARLSCTSLDTRLLVFRTFMWIFVLFLNKRNYSNPILFFYSIIIGMFILIDKWKSEKRNNNLKLFKTWSICNKHKLFLSKCLKLWKERGNVNKMKTIKHISYYIKIIFFLRIIIFKFKMIRQFFLVKY